ncbi:hypothetical protein ITX31_03870 [Arthrobacter gandavensis]|uniref:hypothetical protein n=1 Tax=Arthrobacter gandavensis TaxID=169960 RepID=UPI00188EB7BD|nr:hypothetical protein [Arthrobacter gandavensis]MBF4993250.1 hypothetical protein [Arthrobacter gandavensis]
MTCLQVLPVLVLWAVVAIRLLGLRYGWKAGVLPAVTAVALAGTLNIDPVYLAVDQALGGRNVLNLLIHLLVGAGMTLLSRLLLQVTGRGRRVKVLFAVWLVVAAGQIVLLAVSDTRGSAASFTDTFGSIPTIAWYQATFFGWFAMICVYTAIEMMLRNRSGESRAFRIGFDVLGAGCVLGVAAAVLKMIQIGMEQRGFTDSGGALAAAYQVLLALMVGGFAVGFILPSAERIRSTFRARGQREQDIATLRPILARLVQTPEGRSAMGAERIFLEERPSRVQLYRWFIFVGDVRILDPALLSRQETAVLDEIGKRIEHNGSPVPRSTGAGR